MLFALPLRCKLTSGVVANWYRNRACEMESLSKQVPIHYAISFSGFKIGIFTTQKRLYRRLAALSSLNFKQKAAVYTRLFTVFIRFITSKMYKLYLHFPSPCFQLTLVLSFKLDRQFTGTH